MIIFCTKPSYHTLLTSWYVHISCQVPQVHFTLLQNFWCSTIDSVTGHYISTITLRLDIVIPNLHDTEELWNALTSRSCLPISFLDTSTFRKHSSSPCINGFIAWWGSGQCLCTVENITPTQKLQQNPEDVLAAMTNSRLSLVSLVTSFSGWPLLRAALQMLVVYFEPQKQMQGPTVICLQNSSFSVERIQCWKRCNYYPNQSKHLIKSTRSFLYSRS